MATKGTHGPEESAFGQQSVAIYTRVSTDNQVGGRFDSCESQAACCREHIERKKNEGWHEVACLTDAAYSGATLNRPGMNALKRMVEAGEVKIVLVYKLERVMRSTDEWIPFRAFLKRHGCRLESATEDISENTPSGRLKNMLMMSFNTYERENTAEKTLAKMQQQAKRGIWNGGPVPYGYSYDKNTQNLQPHPVEGPIVQRVFDRAARLVSLTDIANELNAEGLRTKERIYTRRDGSTHAVGANQFRSDGLRLMLRNPIYRGCVKFSGKEFPARHEALVASDLWDRANAATAEVKVRPQHLFQERDAQNHLLKGLAWCSGCGRAFVPNDSGKKGRVKYRYYTCSLVMRGVGAAGCSVGRLSADALEKSVIAVIGEAAKHPMVVAEMVQVSRNSRGTDRNVLRAELDSNVKEVTTVEKQLRKCADAVALGKADALSEVLAERATALKAQRHSLLLEQERIRQSFAACEATLLDERRITDNLDRLGKLLPSLPPREQKELIRLFVERVSVSRLVPRGHRSADVGPPDPRQRLLELRIKLHLPQLVQGLEARSGIHRPAINLRLRGLELDAQVDFSNAQRGEIAIVAPFQRAMRLDSRVRTVPPILPKVEHPILRAQEWQRMLQSGEVTSRQALARRVRLTPGAITRIMKLVELAPDIQAYLASLKSANAIWHFGYRPVGRLAGLPVEQQRIVFSKMRADYEGLQRRKNVAKNVAPITPVLNHAGRPARGLSAG